MDDAPARQPVRDELGAAALALTIPAVNGIAPVRIGVALGAVLAAGMYVHYFAAFTGLAVLLGLLAWHRWRTAVVAMGTAAVLFAPGALMLAQQVETMRRMATGGWQPRVNAGGVFQAFSGLFAATGDFTPGLALAALLMLGAALGLRRVSSPAVRLLLVFLGCGILLPLAIGTSMRFVTPRYLAASLPALLLLTAAGISTLPARIATPVTALLLMACAGLIVDGSIRFDGQKLALEEALAFARLHQALPVVQGKLFAPAAAFYAPSEVAYAYPPPPLDVYGLYALPPGPVYPPAAGKPILFLDYCHLPPASLSAYRLESRTTYPGDLCLDLETVAGTVG